MEHLTPPHLAGPSRWGKAALAESLKLKPQINSLAQHYALKPWHASPKELELERRTLNEGLRRIGFPEK
jgi:hypothetical protein